MRSSLTIPIAIIIGGIVVAGAVYLSMRHPTPTAPSAGDPTLVRPVNANDHILGNPAAPVVIVEYADFDCEFCKGFSETLNQIVANEGAGGKVAWVFREFPLIEIHPDTSQNAEAAECAAQAGGNEAFWKFANELFANQPANPADYGTYAADANIPGDAFATCFADASSTVDARISADRQNALSIGAAGTPYSVIIAQGRPPIVMDGAYSYDAVKQLVDQALGQ